MTFPTLKTDMKGDTLHADGIAITYDSMTNVVTPDATRAYVLAGTGAPTFTAPQGTLYLNLTGSSTSTRAYINTTGSTTWTAITTVA